MSLQSENKSGKWQSQVSTQYSVITYMGKESKKECVCVCVCVCVCMYI